VAARVGVGFLPERANCIMITGCVGGRAGLTSERPAVAVPGSPVPVSVIPRLKTIADRAAKENGDAAPSWISAVVTTQEQALAFVNGGSGPGGDTVVYLVMMKGHFTWPRAGPVPLSGQPAHPRTGHYVYVMVKAGTFEQIARGLRPGPPPVAPSSLGPVTWLKR
jgi:hypothetical protein